MSLFLAILSFLLFFNGNGAVYALDVEKYHATAVEVVDGIATLFVMSRFFLAFPASPVD